MSLTYRAIFELAGTSGAAAEAADELANGCEQWLIGEGYSQADNRGDIGPDSGLFLLNEGRTPSLRARSLLYAEQCGEFATRVECVTLSRDGCESLLIEQEVPDLDPRTAVLPDPPSILNPILEKYPLGSAGFPLQPTFQRCDTEDETEELLRWLSSADRIPAVIVHDRGGSVSNGRLLSELRSRTLGSTALVAASGELIRLLRDEHLNRSAFPVGSLLFLPTPGHGNTKSVPFPSTICANQPAAVGRRIQLSVLRNYLQQSVPVVWEQEVFRLPGFRLGPQGDEATALALAEELQDQFSAANRRASDLEVELGDLTLDLEEALAELGRAKRRNVFLERRLRETSDHAYAFDSGDDMLEPESCEMAVEFAREYLELLGIYLATKPTRELEGFERAGTWAQKSWDAFQALDSYARFKSSGAYTGNFLGFCSDSPSEAFTIPAGWIALNESESTNQNPDCVRVRTFPVPESVSREREVYMASHIKLDKGGRPAPRIHFYDDTGGETGKIYIGYFGAHLPTGAGQR